MIRLFPNGSGLFFILLSLPSLVCCVVNTQNGFSTPGYLPSGRSREWALGEEMVVSWVTTLDVYNMTFWQNLPGQNAALKQGIVYSKIDPEDPTLNFTWVTQLYNFDLAVSNVFFFWINDNVPDEAIPSAYFIITEPDRETTSSVSSSSSTLTSISTSASTSSLTSETSTPTSTPTGNSTTTDSNPSSPPRNSTPSEPDSSTSTNKTALGVGLGVGIPILGALAALIWIQVHKAKNAGKGVSLGNAPNIDVSRPRLPPVELSARHYRELAA